tara:strand:- start:6047 stop:6661 length:615 start_codon:yes stop_codon:yes gene_type:complete
MNKKEREKLALRVNARRYQINAMATEFKVKVGMTQTLFDTVLSVVSYHFDVDEERIVSRDRNVNVMDARHAVFYLCRMACPKTSLSSIGSMIGRDHSTVINAMKRCDQLRETDPVYSHKFELAYKDLRARIPDVKPLQLSDRKQREVDMQHMIAAKELITEVFKVWDEYLAELNQDDFMNAMARIRAQGAGRGLVSPLYNSIQF